MATTDRLAYAARGDIARRDPAQLERLDQLLGQGDRLVPEAERVDVGPGAHPAAGPVARTPPFSALALRRSCSASPTSAASSTNSTGTPSVTA